LKSLLYGVLFVALAGCTQAGSNGDGTTAQSDTTASTTTSSTTVSETSASETPMTSATPAPAAQEKPMSDYENKIVELHTDKGQINLRFFPAIAPNHVKNFIDLAKSGFFDGTKFHRTIPGFVIQGGDPLTKNGDPRAWGTGGSDKLVKAEFNPTPHKRGILSMARSNDPNSASSQFFICVADVPSLDNKYTVFGEVTSGMDVADAIVNAPTVPGTDRPANPVTITKAVVRDAREDEKKK
jgi:peptidyl-prolyl cis-trans isomerase B (cyclophilin B)